MDSPKPDLSDKGAKGVQGEQATLLFLKSIIFMNVDRKTPN